MKIFDSLETGYDFLAPSKTIYMDDHAYTP